MFIVIYQINCVGQVSPIDSIQLFKHTDFERKSVFKKLNQGLSFDLNMHNKKFVLFYIYNSNSNKCNPNHKRLLEEKPLDTIISNHFFPLEISNKESLFDSVVKKFRISALPILIFTDTLMNELHRYCSDFNTNNLQRTISDFVYKQKGVNLYKKKFENGERTLNFLRDYSYLLRDANMLDSAMILNVLNRIPTKQMDEPDNIRFVQEFIYYRLNPFVPIDHPICVYYYKNQSKFEKYFTHEQVKSNVIWLAINHASNACKSQDEKLFKQSISILEKEPYKKHNAYVNLNKDTIGRIISPDVMLTLKMSFFHASQKSKYLNEVLSEIRKTYWNDWKALNEFAWIVYRDKKKNPILIKNALEWIQQSVLLNRNYHNLDTYASLLYLQEDYLNALKLAYEAIELEPKIGNKPTSSHAIVDEIKKKLVTTE